MKISHFIENHPFRSDSSSYAESVTSGDEVKVKPSKPALKSQRYLDTDGIEGDLKVPKSMQDFMHKKLSKKIAETIDFIEIDGAKKKTKRKDIVESVPSVRLLKDTDPIKYLDVTEGEAADWVKPTDCKRLEVKRKVVEPIQVDEDEMIRMATVDGKDVLAKRDTEAWKKRKGDKKKLFEYRQKQKTLHLIERDNEFSKLRRKNKWDESKIAKKEKR